MPTYRGEEIRFLHATGPGHVLHLRGEEIYEVEVAEHVSCFLQITLRDGRSFLCSWPWMIEFDREAAWRRREETHATEQSVGDPGAPG